MRTTRLYESCFFLLYAALTIEQDEHIPKQVVVPLATALIAQFQKIRVYTRAGPVGEVVLVVKLARQVGRWTGQS